MNIVELNTRIIFQKKTLDFDELHQQIESWSDEFTCWANLKLVNSNEDEKNVASKVSETISFVVRKVNELRTLNPLEYRIVLNKKAFDVVEVDTFSKDNRFLRIKGVTKYD